MYTNLMTPNCCDTRLTMLYETLNPKLSHSSTAFLRNVTDLRLVKKFSTSYGTGRLNIVPRRADHWFITRIWKIESINSYVISLRYTSTEVFKVASSL
jgi:hypothetical protein